MNKVRCLHCGITIASEHRHDFVRCSCPAEAQCGVAVDGGPDYKKRAFFTNSRWVEINEDGSDGEVCPKPAQGGGAPGTPPA